MPNKSKNQRFHAKQRALERFGLDLNRHKLKDLVDMIQSGKAEFIEKQSNRVSLFKINYENKDLFVVYDKQRKNIVTFLLPEMVSAS